MNAWRERIRTIPNFPKPGILFRDITPVFADPGAFDSLLAELEPSAESATHIVGIEARGFLLGAPLASRLGLPFVLVRKEGKLPSEVVSASYELEYGSATIELDRSALREGDRVLLVDDLIATGGTLLAAASLVEQLGASVVRIAAAIDLPDLGGSAQLRDAGYEVVSLVSFSGD